VLSADSCGHVPDRIEVERMTTLDRLLLAYRRLGADEREVLALIAERLVEALRARTRD
jgi:hypothetical protein